MLLLKKVSKIQSNETLRNLKKEIWRHRALYVFLIPALLTLIIFRYVPMYGVLMAFQDVKIGDTFGQSDWIGLYHFRRFFSSSWFPIIMKNTALISLLANVLMWPAPLILAILLHNSNNVVIKKLTQNFTYLPYLLSAVIVVSIVNLFCAGESGLINIFLLKFGKERINFFGDPVWVYPLHAITTVWKSAGYNAIIYLGALSTVDEQMIEAARVDGAGKLRCIWNIQIPTIMPTVVTMLILNMGHMFYASVDKALLLQTDLNLANSEIIGTYVYKAGITSSQYGFATAMGLFQNIINIMLLIIVNYIAKKTTDTSVV